MVNLNFLDPWVKEGIRALHSFGQVNFAITSAWRGREKQNSLQEEGRTKVRYPCSQHNWGYAWDAVVDQRSPRLDLYGAEWGVLEEEMRQAGFVPIRGPRASWSVAPSYLHAQTYPAATFRSWLRTLGHPC